jgi:CO/xanthine dehydrogenase FAD-binding subunit
LKTASHQVGGVQIQNRGTIAGNLCNASPAADGVPPLLALDAQVEIMSLAGMRKLPLDAFILANRRTALKPDELVTAILVPHPDASEQSVFLKLGARAYLIISIASVAANLAISDDGRISKARISIGACSAVPQRLTGLEGRLHGLLPAEASLIVTPAMLATLLPIDDVRGSAAYRLDAALTLVRRALQELAQPERRAA